MEQISHSNLSTTKPTMTPARYSSSLSPQEQRTSVWHSKVFSGDYISYPQARAAAEAETLLHGMPFGSKYIPTHRHASRYGAQSLIQHHLTCLEVFPKRVTINKDLGWILVGLGAYALLWFVWDPFATSLVKNSKNVDICQATKIPRVLNWDRWSVFSPFRSEHLGWNIPYSLSLSPSLSLFLSLSLFHFRLFFARHSSRVAKFFWG